MSNEQKYEKMLEKAELFFIDTFKELPLGNGKYKIKAECSVEEFIENFHKAIEL